MPYAIVALIGLCGAARDVAAGPQKDAVCQGSCGGGCGPCNTGGNQAGNSAPAQPSAWLRNREQLLEKRGVAAYDRCVADFARGNFDDAIDHCHRSLAAYTDAFGSPTSARGREASQALAAAENARASELFHRGRCGEAAALFHAAAEHDPGTGAYGRNATLFTASACTAAASARRGPVAAVPPPPPPRFAAPSPAPVAIAAAPGGITGAALDAARETYHRGAQLVGELVTRAIAVRIPAGELIAETAAQLTEAAELRTHYNELARDLVTDATGAISEAAEIGAHGGDAGHAVDSQARASQRVNQFASDQTREVLEQKTRGWAASRLVPAPAP